MKKHLFLFFTALLAIGFMSCEKGGNGGGLDAPTGFKVSQNGSTLVLEWQAVSGAESYSLTKNDQFWQTTSATRVVDENPVKGMNTYTLIASNGDKVSPKVSASYNFQSSGQGGEDPQEETYYIKHPWNGGTWEWKKMQYEGEGQYSYRDCYWGGTGANINTSASDEGAQWFPSTEIEGADKAKAGDKGTFVYVSASKALHFIVESSGGEDPQGTTYYIKHPWGSGSDSSWEWKKMTKSGNSYTYTGAWGGIGANINSSADDSGAEWYPKENISGASSVSVGTTVTFTFTPSNGNKGSLSVSSDGGGGQSSTLSAPTGLTASAGSSSISLSWNSVSGATSYKVYRATSASGNYTERDNVGNTNYTDYDVTKGTTYYYKVTALNSAGESAKSSAVSAKIASSGGSKPSTPSNLKAEASGSCIALSWNGVSTASSYVVYRSTSASGTYTELKETSHTYTSDCTVSSGVTYYYKVASKNSYGTSSQSSYVSATIGGSSTTKPSAPTNLQVVQNGNSMQLTWNAVSNATKYYIYRSTSSSSGFDSPLDESYSNSYEDNYALVDGTTYYYKVSAVNIAGEGSKSSYVSCQYKYVYIPTDPPCDPSNVRVSITSATTTIKWDVDNYGAGCGKVTYRKLTFLDYTTGNSVEKTTSNDYYLLTNTERDKYVNNGYLVFFLYLSNDKGAVNWQYKCNIGTGEITNQVKMY